ncbi:MAG TPA: pyridoxal-dependent decarboxylase, partial [bacterium]|nr:pyridoxal-dependent decarboxylase [bacterium]
VPALRGQVAGVERADSWALDAHKWLNVPYDCGLAFTAHAPAHRAALTTGAPYLIASAARDPLDWTPEASRRARGFTVYAALRSLGRDGVADLVARCCRLARRMAARLQAEPGVTILNEIALNQVLVRFTPRGGGDADGLTRAVIARVQRDGVCWTGGTTWRGKGAMRISVSGWQTTETDIDRSTDAIIGAFRAEASSA